MQKKDLQRIEFLAVLLDSQFRIPFTRIRVGLDALVGIIPLWGDILTFIMASSIVYTMAKSGVPAPVLFRAVLNVLMDYLVGVLPLIGDFADIFYKGNLKNLDLARKYHHQPRGVSIRSWSLIGFLGLIFISFLTLLLWATLRFWSWVFSL
jgi:hypothetical protein